VTQFESDRWSADEPPQKVDARKLWAGGLATALVAAGVGVAGVLLIRGLLKIPILSAGGSLVNQAIATVPIAAAVAALAATGLLHLLVLTTPRPRLFFGSICVVVMAVIVLLVFAGAGSLQDKAATSILYVLIGVVILGLLSGVARTAIHPTYRQPDNTMMMRPDQGYQGYQGYPPQQGPGGGDYYQR
jgi:Family of unknown function (DUF6069)